MDRAPSLARSLDQEFSLSNELLYIPGKTSCHTGSPLLWARPQGLIETLPNQCRSGRIKKLNLCLKFNRAWNTSSRAKKYTCSWTVLHSSSKVCWLTVEHSFSWTVLHSCSLVVVHSCSFTVSHFCWLTLLQTLSWTVEHCFSWTVVHFCSLRVSHFRSLTVLHSFSLTVVHSFKRKIFELWLTSSLQPKIQVLPHTIGLRLVKVGFSQRSYLRQEFRDPDYHTRILTTRVLMSEIS